LFVAQSPWKYAQVLRRGGPSRASGRRRFGRSPQSLAPDPDSGKHDEDAEFWSRRLDDPPPQSRLEPTRPAPGARDAPPARPSVHAATERDDAELAELADAMKAELQRVAVECQSAVDSRCNEATERHESRLAELADETSGELSRVAAQFGRAIDARLDDAERHEVKLAELADATRAELSRIAARFERVATDRIAQVEDLTVRAAAQAQEISECMAGLDQREAEFTRRVEEGLEHLDSRFAAWRDELTQFRRAHDASLESATKRLTELISRVDRDHGSFGNATAQRVQELENALAEQRQAMERLQTADCERAAAQRHDALARARAEQSSEIHWIVTK
jgi:hypothetical protein